MREPLRPIILTINFAFLFSKKKSQLNILAKIANAPAPIEMINANISLFSSILCKIVATVGVRIVI